MSQGKSSLPKKPTQQIVTANRLIDGAVVYLTVDGDWTIWISDAALANTSEQAVALLSAAEEAVTENNIVEPYLIEVRPEASTIKPVRYREAIRSKGPTTHPHHGRPMASHDTASGVEPFLNGV